ncbi:PAS domain S-box protein, partial [Lentimicrobium sp. S6]|nr:PAS domain S-box protein [Lentimicrobium sp. S6]
MIQIIARDITERKQAEEKIQSNLQQIEVINANTPNIIWKTDIDQQGNFINTYISDIVDEFLALPKGTVNNNWDKYFSYVIPEYLPQINEIFKNGINNLGEMISFSYEVKKADNTLAWFTSKGKAVFEDKKLTVYGSTIDITEQKLAEKKLKDSETRFKALHNASFGGIAIHDKGMILECNQGLTEISGYEQDELMGMDGLLLIAEESREKVMGNILSGSEESYEAVGIRKNGQKYSLRLEARQIPYKGKEVRVVEFRDITERKRAETELVKLSTAVQQSPSVIAITDTKGNLEYVNPQFTESTGYSTEEAIEQNPSVLKSGEQSEEFYKELWETISSGNTWRGEFHNKKKNGELFWEIASVSPIFDEQGKIINYIKVAEDITERKQAEDNFRHSIDESPLGIRIVNQKGKTIYV